MAEKAVRVEEQSTSVNLLRILLRSDGGLRRVLVTERGCFQDSFAIQGESENAAPSRLGRANRWRVHLPGSATPPGHDGHILNAVDCVGDGRSHDSGVAVKLPDLLAIRRAIRGKDTIGAA